MKRLDVTNGFYQQTIFSTYQKNYNNNTGSHEHNYEDDFDEYL